MVMIWSMERAEERWVRCGLGFSRDCREVRGLDRVVGVEELSCYEQHEIARTMVAREIRDETMMMRGTYHSRLLPRQLQSLDVPKYLDMRLAFGFKPGVTPDS
jgi:hypothetical protein